MNPELKRAAELADAYINSFDTHKVSAEPDPEALRARLYKELTPDGLPPLQVIDDLAEDAKEGLLNSAGGRFFGWVIGGSIPVSIAADWLTSAWDQNAAAYACSPTAAIIEDVVAGWLKDLLGLPPHASYAFVTGCQMAHVTALAAARHKVLADKGWSVEEQGLAGSPPIRVLVGEHHETLLRALRHLGIGTDALVLDRPAFIGQHLVTSRRLADLGLGSKRRRLRVFAGSRDHRRRGRRLAERHSRVAATCLLRIRHRLPDGPCHGAGCGSSQGAGR